MKKFFLLFFAVSLIWCTFAHQPRLVFDQPVGQIVNVENPEISQAFYGILSWQDDIYQIVSDTGFLLYVSIVVPKIYGSKTDFIVDIIEGNNTVYTRLDGKEFTWTDFFEPFGGDRYLQWPSLEKHVGSGIYIIRVSNPENQWKYSLAIGKIESFPVNEIITTYKVLPELKTVFFDKPRYTALRNIVGMFLLWMIFLLIAIIRWIRKIIRYKRRKK